MSQNPANDLLQELNMREDVSAKWKDRKTYRGAVDADVTSACLTEVSEPNNVIHAEVAEDMKVCEVEVVESTGGNAAMEEDGAAVGEMGASPEVEVRGTKTANKGEKSSTAEKTNDNELDRHGASSDMLPPIADKSSYSDESDEDDPNYSKDTSDYSWHESDHKFDAVPIAMDSRNVVIKTRAGGTTVTEINAEDVDENNGPGEVNDQQKKENNPIDAEQERSMQNDATQGKDTYLSRVNKSHFSGNTAEKTEEQVRKKKTTKEKPQESGRFVVFEISWEKRNDYRTPQKEQYHGKISVMRSDNKKYDKVAYCMVCNEAKKELRTHLLQHKDEPLIAKYLATTDQNERRQLLAQIRNTGNHLHNCRVLKEGEGVIVPVYRPKYDADHKLYQPCNSCLGWYAESDFQKHACKIGERNAESADGRMMNPTPCEERTYNKVVEGVNKDMYLKRVSKPSDAFQSSAKKRRKGLRKNETTEKKTQQSGSNSHVQVSCDKSTDGGTSQKERGNQGKITVMKTDNKGGRKFAYCMVCSVAKVDLRAHLPQHEDEPLIAKYFATTDQKERLQLLSQIRNTGNHLHNCQVLKEGEGVIVPFYRPDHDVDHELFQPCVSCLGWYSKSEMLKHACKVGKSNSIRGKSVEEIELQCDEECASEIDDQVPEPDDTTELCLWVENVNNEPSDSHAEHVGIEAGDGEPQVSTPRHAAESGSRYYRYQQNGIPARGPRGP
ncbi:uncharacterized protein [Diadema antillarum]|uniref:uncharacterized protein n=1 Tax=Diadema antillarum TaxID=105358 RepID=UPI003A892B92